MANLIALALATAVLVAIPGPNVALIVANSLRYGFWMGATTAVGVTLGNAIQLVAVVAGMAAIVELAADALTEYTPACRLFTEVALLEPAQQTQCADLRQFIEET